ncbi:MAG TPA: hypothetical protein O0X59_04280 [Methanocorpusculum sp.]|nr:hypothetical protein [Methanocorpusculum sp.]
MTDIRIRLIVVILLSLSAFTGVLGTLLAAACWIVFCAEETFSHNSWKLFMPSAVLAAGFPGLILYLSGGDGGIYAAKIFVIFCLAFWLGVSHKPGEFLDLGVWALGRKTGFDLGLSAELTMQYLSGISDDLSHMKSALRIKGERPPRKPTPPLATGLLLLSLSRSGRIGAYLARRGYHTGGTYLPHFPTTKTDILMLCTAGVCAAAVLSAASPAL